MLKEKSNILWILIIFSALFSGCQHPENTYTNEARIAYFSGQKWNGDWGATLPLKNPDGIIQRIKTDVPEIWQSWACENAYFHLPDTAQSVLQFQYLDKIEKAFPNDSVRAFALLMRGYNLFLYAQYDSAVKCYNECYDISIKQNRLTRASDAEFYLGQIRANRGDYPEGIRLIKEAYSMALSLGEDDGGRIYETMFTTSQIYRNIEDYTSAQIWLQKLWNYSFAKDTRKEYQIRTAGYMANNYQRLQKIDSAKILIDTTFALMDLYNIRVLQPVFLCFRAEINTVLGNADAAFSDLKTAWRDSAIMIQPRLRARYNRVIGLAYLTKNQLDSALIFFNQSLVTNDTLHQARVEMQIAEIYKLKGNIVAALDHQSRSMDLRNRVLSATKERALERIQLKDETDKKLAAATYQSAITRQRTLIGFLVCTLLLAISLFAFNRLKQQKIILAQEKEIAQKEVKLKNLVLTQLQKTVSVQKDELIESAKLLDFKNSIIKSLELRLEQQQMPNEEDAASTPDAAPSLRSLRILTPNDWNRFRQLFDIQYPGFSQRLKNQYPDLTNSEIRLFLLIKAGFEANEIADITGVSISTVYKSRYRLRRKLKLEEENNLEKHVQAFY